MIVSGLLAEHKTSPQATHQEGLRVKDFGGFRVEGPKPFNQQIPKLFGLRVWGSGRSPKTQNPKPETLNASQDQTHIVPGRIGLRRQVAGWFLMLDVSGFTGLIGLIG